MARAIKVSANLILKILVNALPFARLLADIVNSRAKPLI